MAAVFVRRMLHGFVREFRFKSGVALIHVGMHFRADLHVVAYGLLQVRAVDRRHDFAANRAAALNHCENWRQFADGVAFAFCSRRHKTFVGFNRAVQLFGKAGIAQSMPDAMRHE